MEKDFTSGSLLRGLAAFSFPYMLSCFLQTFYGMADLYVIGQFKGAASISAVSIGSQVMHMLTVMIVGLAMGSTVNISQAIGKKDTGNAARSIGNTVILFAFLSVFFTILLLLGTDAILTLLSTPQEAVIETKIYLRICFAGIPLIVAYNIISCIFRGVGDSQSPLLFIAVACVCNIAFDFLFIGGLKLGAAGAAFATVLSQGISVATALYRMVRKKTFSFSLKKSDFRPYGSVIGNILKIGIPVSCQDGFIQISFLFITAIANSRGVTAAASVGIVEKIISFLFLVPSAMLASISAIAAQNVGAGRNDRARQILWYGTSVAVIFGAFMAFSFQFFSPTALSLFTKDNAVIAMGTQYLKAYVLDCMIAGIHFCFSGFFCAYGKSSLSFIQNFLSIILIRIPGAYLASVLFPSTLYPMGLAAPAGSLFSVILCILLYFKVNWEH
ncbi:MAG: MATE family efflux transporter [Eubacteriales bacterium]|nr:MATE family efflux transporter [Eubacteriales bacterium]